MKHSVIVAVVMLASTIGSTPAARAAACADRLSPKANISELFDCLKEMNREIEELKRAALPERTVLIVNETERCPAGWSSVRRAEGRFIIGAHDNATYDSSVDPDVSRRFPGERGGSEAVALTIPQIPAHTHGYQDVFFSEIKQWMPKEAIPLPIPDGVGHANKVDYDNVGWAQERKSDATGADAAHDNMPPYVAFFFCMRVTRE